MPASCKKVAASMRKPLAKIFQRGGATAIILGGMLIQQSFAFISGIVSGHAVGAEGFGITNILRNMITAALALSPIGLDLALLKYGPRFISPRTFAMQLVRMRFMVAALNVTLVLVVWGALGNWLEHAVYKTPGFRDMLLISLVGLPLAADIQLMSATYRVRNRPARFALMSSWLQPPLRLGGAVLTLWYHWSVYALVVSSTLAYLASTLCLSLDQWLAPARVDDEPTAELAERAEEACEQASWGYVRLILGDSAWMALSLFAYNALRFVDVLVLGAFAPKAQVGAYGALSTISQLVAIYPLAISQTLGPSISKHYHEGNMAGVHKVLNDYIRSAALAGGFIFGGVAAFGDHLDLVFGPSFHFDPWLALILPLGWLVSATLAPTGYSLSMTGHHKAELRVLFTGTCILVVGCFAFIPFLQALGAAIAVLIAFLAIDLTRFAMVSRYLGFWPGKLSDLLPPVVAAALGYGCKVLVDAALGRSFFSMIAGCVAYTLLFGTVALINHKALSESLD
jgi:O-antigen/teichoic acid export membrane protein